ncbi:MAG: hypothetical protein IJA87_04110 [Clostridia bacterium]|nr:hypothetical protein [Clostridia bacterium]
MIKNFDTLNDFFNAANSDLHSGDIVVTGGYSAVNDGGAGTYYVISTENTNVASLVISGKTFSKGSVQLELILDSGEVFVEQFGASSTASFTANKAAIQAAIDSGARCINFRPTQYNVGDDILISHPVDIVGNGAKLVLETDSTSTQLFRVEYGENTDIMPASIKDMKIIGTRVESYGTDNTFSYYNILVNIVNAKQFTISDVHFEYGSSAIDTTNSSVQITDINIVNCVFRGFVTGISLCNVKGFKIKNCNIDLLDENGVTGLLMDSNVKSGVVEDVTIVNAFDSAIDYWNGEWSKEINDITIKDATDRILFKNLNIEKCLYGIKINFSDVPIWVSNAIATDVTYGVSMDCAKNVSIMHSSISLLPPETAPEDAVSVYMEGYVQAEFKHVQFEFPWDFQYTGICAHEEATDVGFIDCTIQKTDIDSIPGVTIPKGFGHIGTHYVGEYKYAMTFDGCEFRSYIKNYATTVAGNEEEITNYNFPMMLSALNETDSKLIIKNCRFVNENTCTVPYFKLDGGKFDNIVVYNCFFENYNYKPSEDSSVYPLFGKLTNNGLSCDVDEHNIFAKCNMRSSEPVRNTGTTINETKSYI